MILISFDQELLGMKEQVEDAAKRKVNRNELHRYNKFLTRKRIRNNLYIVMKEKLTTMKCIEDLMCL